MTDLTPRRPSPVLGTIDLQTIDRDMATFIDAYDEADAAGDSPRSAGGALAKLDAASAGLPALRQRLDDLDRPATRKEVAREITLLLASKPAEWDKNPTGEDDRSSMREVWAQLFVEEIGALAPSTGGLRLAGQQLRRSRSDSDYANRRLPPICDVVQAVRDAEARFRRVRRRLSDLPALRARLQQAVDYEAARQARYQQSARLANPATNSTEE